MVMEQSEGLGSVQLGVGIGHELLPRRANACANCALHACEYLSDHMYHLGTPSPDIVGAAWATQA